MAKKRRHRVWWLAVFPEQYDALLKERVLKPPFVLFDKKDLAYNDAYASRFEPLRDEDGNHVLKNDYAQLKDNGKVTLIGIHGSAIKWGKDTIVGREHGNEAAQINHEINLDGKKTVDRVLEESDEAYANHLRSPLARAGGLLVPEEVQERIEARKALREAEKEAATDGEDVGPTTDVPATEDSESTVEHGADSVRS